MTRATDPIEQLTAALSQKNGLKVWSVIVTVLGDMAQMDETLRMPGPDLTALLGKLDLQPDAIRVALHRLRQDGWVESAKRGRTSHHRLSPIGLSETRKVAGRVFDPTPQALPLQLTIAAPSRDEDAAPSQMGGVQLRRGVTLSNDSPAKALDSIVLPMAREDLPLWIADLPQVARARSDFDALADLISGVPRTNSDAQGITALRIAILHTWRRAILRVDPVLEHVPGAREAIMQARRSVLARLNDLPRRYDAQETDGVKQVDPV